MRACVPSNAGRIGFNLSLDESEGGRIGRHDGAMKKKCFSNLQEDFAMNDKLKIIYNKRVCTYYDFTVEFYSYILRINEFV